ncbi:MAG TPA: anthrone oxygenase family protein, partial [Dongiaceae bacterium]
RRGELSELLPSRMLVQSHGIHHAAVVACRPNRIWSCIGTFSIPGSQSGAGRLIAGAAIYTVGGIGVTMLFNVPRNNALAPLKPESAEAATYWPRYVAEWTMWNHVRTIACAVAMAAFIVAMY